MDNPTPTILDQLGIKLGTAVAGLAGAVLATVRARKAHPAEALASFLAGFGCSVFLTGAIAEYFGLSGKVEYALAFILGVVGMSVVTGIVDLAEKFKTDPLGVISYLRKEKAPP